METGDLIRALQATRNVEFKVVLKQGDLAIFCSLDGGKYPLLNVTVITPNSGKQVLPFTPDALDEFLEPAT